MYAHGPRTLRLFGSLLLLTFSVLAAPVATIPGPRGDWRTQEKSASLSQAFGSGKRSFDVNTNRKICNLFTVNIGPPDPAVVDYGLVISSALISVHMFGGGAVRLSRGVYPILSPIILRSRTCLFGAGMGVTFLNVGKTFNNYHAGAGVIRAVTAERITLIDFTLSGARKHANMRTVHAVAFGVHFELANFVWFKNVRSNENPDTGFNFVGSGTRWAYHLALDSCRSEKNGVDGFNFEQTYYTALTSSRPAANARHGIRISTAATTIYLQGNTVVNSGQCGISITPGTPIGQIGRLAPRSILAVNNTLLNSRLAGVCLEDVSSHIAFTGTQIINRRDKNAVCYDVRRSAFSNSRFTCSVASGVTFSPPGRPPWALPIPQGPGQGCGTGVLFKDVCCPSGCGICGGRGCGTRLSDGQCCYTSVKSSRRSCRSNPPPCVIDY